VQTARGRAHPVTIGCSGWNYDHWRNGVFYPPRCAARDWLAYYARHFDTVEVNMTFYRLPKAPIVQRWVHETPPGFVFAVKVSRYITHIKRLLDAHEHLPLLLERLEPLLRSPKLGPLLWQLPPTFQRDLARLDATLEYTRRDGYRHAFEFRHPSWFCEETYELLRQHNAALVIGDRPEVNAFQSHELTADFTFVRFHGGTRGSNGNYSHVELDEWSDRLASWSGQADVFAYFNNDWEGYAIENALYLKRSLGQEAPAGAGLLAFANAAAAQG
jgi:uncharacterized protein YecE (DUF72 family)